MISFGSLEIRIVNCRKNPQNQTVKIPVKYKSHGNSNEIKPKIFIQLICFQVSLMRQRVWPTNTKVTRPVLKAWEN